jgi:hypothetical protein
LNATTELSEADAPTVYARKWEEIALRILESGFDSAGVSLDRSALDKALWSVSDIAADAGACPIGIVHGDLHGGNIAVGMPESDAPVCEASTRSVRLLDWGSAYLGAVFLGLEELIWPASRHLKGIDYRTRMKAAYLREWAPLLGKPGTLERAVAACAALVHIELLDEALRRPSLYGDYATTAMARLLCDSWAVWRRA